MDSASGGERLTLAISGMTCNNCVNHVQKALLGTPGVAKATVDLKRETAHVEARPGVSRAAMFAAVEAAGYGAREAPADSGKAPSWQFWKR